MLVTPERLAFFDPGCLLYITNLSLSHTSSPITVSRSSVYFVTGQATLVCLSTSLVSPDQLSRLYLHMPVECVKCNRKIATAYVSCLTCKNSFHPGCAVPYSRLTSSRSCCRLQFSIPNTPTPRPALSTMAPSPPPSSLDTIVAMLRTSDAKFTAFVDEQREANAAMNVVAEEQRSAIANINAALSDLPKISEAVASNTACITTLEIASEELKSEIIALKAQLTVNSELMRKTTDLMTHSTKRGYQDNALILKGLPSGLPDSPRELVTKILDTLGVPYFASPIASVRPFLKKLPAAADADSITHLDDSPTHLSLLVTVSSSAIRDAIIEAKRQKRDLLASEVFGTPGASKILINDYLPHDTFILLHNIRNKAKTRGVERIWTRNSTIYARKSAGHPKYEINCVEDLDKVA